MAVESQQPLTMSLVAAEDMTAAAKQYRAVKLDVDGNILIVTADTDAAIGILQNNPKLGVAAKVCIVGHSKFRGGGVVAIGNFIGYQADGEFEVLAASSPTRGIVGRCIEATGAAGEIGSALFDFTTARPDAIV